MNISSPFIRRPVATTLLTAGVAIAGIIAFTVLPVAPLPSVDSPTIFVETSLPGANPETMASSVATPLERQFSHIAGVTEMTSQSSTGTSNVSLQFDLNKNIDAAAREVQAAISAARSNLPANLPSNPSYRKMNESDAPICGLSLTSDIYDPGTLYDQASTVLSQRFLQIPGVGEVNMGGSSLPAVRIEANPLALQSYSMSMSSLATFLKLQSVDKPKGHLTIGDRTVMITGNDQIMKAADYRPLVVGYHNGAPVRLQDVANVIDSVESTHSAGFLNGVPAVNMIVFKQPGANVIETVDALKAQLPAIRSSLPKGMKLTLDLDSTTTIRGSLHDVERTLIISTFMVIFVSFLFLRDGRAILVPAVSVPASLIGTFAVMYFLNYSLDNLSLMAITVSTGFVSDDTIVVMENITRFIEGGMDPMRAAFKGAKEIGFTIVSISLSLIAVFIPILMMGGLVGRLFREFAVTLSIAILISMILSLTTTPMLCSRLLRSTKEVTHGALFRWSDKLMQKSIDLYRGSLRVVLNHSWVVLGVFVLTIGINVVLLVNMQKGFFPSEDTGAIMGGIQGPQDASFAKMQTAVKQIANVIKSDPGVENVIAFTGGRGTSNGGFVYISLKPLSERKVSASAIVDRLRPKLQQVTTAQTFMMAAQDLHIGGRQSNTQYQYTLQADTVADLRTWAPILTRELKKNPSIQDINSDMQAGGLEANLVYDRVTAARLGLTPEAMNEELYNNFGQSQALTLFKSLNQYHVVLEADPKFTQGPDSLRDTYLENGSGSVPLDEISSYRIKTAALSVNHTGLYPSSTISFNLAPGVSLSQATDKIKTTETRLGMPTSVHGVLAGTMQAYRDALASEPILILTAILSVYIVLGMLYESVMHPITILSTLPAASLGAVLTLMISGEDLNIITIIGIILVIGIVQKNAIMMIDFALQAERERHLTTRAAIFDACTLRFRPIMMTTMASICGALPLAFGFGVGSELRRPLGLTIIGGLVVSQVLTLYTTPVIYLFLDRVRLSLNRLVGRNAEPTMEAI
jgi:multidrug efflux pump